MTLEQIEVRLKEVAKVRIPVKIRRGLLVDGEWHPISPREKISEVESYLLLCAETRGVAEEARMWAHEATNLVRHEWDHLKGWEAFLPGSSAKATQPQVMEAKRKVREDLYDGLKKGDYLIRRLSEQIERLTQDEKTASRVYTVITGG